MSEQEKVTYFKKLQQNYKKQQDNIVLGKKAKLPTQSSDKIADSHEKVYIRSEYIPLETNYYYKEGKDRGYGCSNCSVF